MTFDDSPTTNPNIRPNPFTQDVGRPKDVKAFQQTPMMLSDHPDPDKHWVGDALAPPSLEEVSAAGITTATGVSPFVARADHSHDIQFLRTSYLTGSRTTCAPGAVFISTFSNWLGGFADIRAPSSNQVFVIPVAGIWLISLQLDIERSGGGTFTGEMNINEFFAGSSNFNIILVREGMNNIPAVHMAHATFTKNFAVGDTWQVRYEQSDSVNHNVASGHLSFTRLGLIS